MADKHGDYFLSWLQDAQHVAQGRWELRKLQAEGVGGLELAGKLRPCRAPGESAGNGHSVQTLSPREAGSTVIIFIGTRETACKNTTDERKRAFIDQNLRDYYWKDGRFKSHSVTEVSHLSHML
ncbi:hypothetical protein P4O66_006408, partial [Electrophorus voltai]